MDDISAVSLVGVSGGVLIILLVQAIKVFGLPDRLVQQVTLLCALIVSAAYGWLQNGPYDKVWWVTLVVRALVMGLTAAGLYSHIMQPAKLANGATDGDGGDGGDGGDDHPQPSSALPAQPAEPAETTVQLG